MRDGGAYFAPPFLARFHEIADQAGDAESGGNQPEQRDVIVCDCRTAK